MIEPIIGKYCVVCTTSPKNNTKRLEYPILVTDNPREAVWTANKDPLHNRIDHICGEKDFYLGDDDKWHSFDL